MRRVQMLALFMGTFVCCILLFSLFETSSSCGFTTVRPNLSSPTAMASSTLLEETSHVKPVQNSPSAANSRKMAEKEEGQMFAAKQAIEHEVPNGLDYQIISQVKREIEYFSSTWNQSAEVTCDAVKTTWGFRMCVHAADVISNEIRKTGAWEKKQISRLRDELAKHPTSLFLDVGSNIGTWGLSAAQLGHDVIAFEPLKSNFELLLSSFKMNGWRDNLELVPFGASRRHSTFRFNTHAMNFGWNELQPESYPTGKLGVNFGVGVPIDSALGFLRNRTIIMKMDIEGISHSFSFFYCYF